MTRKVENYLVMETTTGYLSLYLKLNHAGSLEGMMGLFVDDSIGTSNMEFERFCRRTESQFYSQPRVLIRIKFEGIDIDRENDIFITGKTKYILKLNTLLITATVYTFFSLRHQLSWLCNEDQIFCLA